MPRLGEIQPISTFEFKVFCLPIHHRVKRTGQPVPVRRRGEPIARVIPQPAERPESWLGCMAGGVKILGRVVTVDR